jgi:hypothetical protein
MTNPKKEDRDLFDGLSAKMATTEHGRMMLDAGWKIANTGGGCFCWEKVAEGDYAAYVRISDQNSDLGDTADENYLVGLYAPDGEPFINGPDNLNLAAALSLADGWLKDPRKYLTSAQ